LRLGALFICDLREFCQQMNNASYAPCEAGRKQDVVRYSHRGIPEAQVSCPMNIRTKKRDSFLSARPEPSDRHVIDHVSRSIDPVVDCIANAWHD
jgi:hypothetical protein